MSGHDIAQILGAHAATSRHDARVLHLVAHGVLSPRDAARQLDGIPREQRDRALDVFAPPSKETRALRLRTLLEQLETPSTPRWATSVLIVAAAACLCIMLGRSSAEDPLELAGHYLLRAQELPSPLRSAPISAGEDLRIGPDGSLRVTLVPSTKADGPIDIAVFARGPSGAPRPIRVSPRVSPKGTAVLELHARKAGLHVGEWTLLFVVGRPRALPSSWSEAIEAEDDGVLAYEVIRRRVRVSENAIEP